MDARDRDTRRPLSSCITSERRESFEAEMRSGWKTERGPNCWPARQRPVQLAAARPNEARRAKGANSRKSSSSSTWHGTTRGRVDQVERERLFVVAQHLAAERRHRPARLVIPIRRLESRAGTKRGANEIASRACPERGERGED